MSYFTLTNFPNFNVFFIESIGINISLNYDQLFLRV